MDKQNEEEEEPTCPECGREIDPEICWCGDAIDSHNMWSGHSPVPVGCVCGYGFKREKP